MTSSRRSRREAARAKEAQSRRRLIIPLIVIGAVLVAAIAAIAMTGGLGSAGPSPSVAPSPTGGAASSLPPSSSLSPSTSPVPGGAAVPPVVTGTPLPKYDPAVASDAAVGQTIPTVAGTDFKGNPVSIDLNGKAKVLVFLAHWCPHCQTEVPLIQAWLDGGGSTGDVELISIATGINPAYPNYPPSAWLEREGWTVPVIADITGTVGPAYGLSAYPFWVFVGADGKVAGRLTGELSIANLQTILASLPR